MGTHNNAPAPSQAGGSFEGQRESLFASLQRHAPVPTRAPAAAPSPLTFAECARLGYGQRLVPIIPPDASISERSSLFKRVDTKQDGRGKTPGVRGRDGNWYGFDWLPHEADERDLERWGSMSAGIGIKTGSGLILIDADTLNESSAAIIAKAVEQHFGRLPLRIGRSPKAGYLLRVSEPVRYQRVEFGALNAKGRPGDRVEILSDGRQFVAHGVHPRTGRPYFWPRPLVPFEALPVASASQITAFLEELRTLLPASKPIITEGAPTKINQEALKGRPDLVAKAVRAIPNTSEHFPTRESYRDFGYAIKAALPDHEAEAFDLFSDWCARWQDGENEPDIVEADWRRMKPPFRRGAGWLYELAEQHAPDQFSRAEQWFETPPEPHESLFPETPPQIATPAIVWRRPADWEGKERKPQEWEVENLIPRRTVSLLTGDGGVGKTLLAQQLATAKAAGKDLFGLKTLPGRAACFLCEDSEDVLYDRQLNICNSMGLTLADVGDRLLIASREFEDNMLAVFDRGVMKLTPLYHKLLADAKAFRADMVIIDTTADTFGGSEIDRQQVRQYVQGCLGGFVREIGCSVLALGHPSLSGMASGKGTSGSTGWNNSVRSRLYLKRPDKDANGDTRELEGKKSNYGPAEPPMTLRWSRGAFELLKRSMPTAALDSDRVEAVLALMGDALWRDHCLAGDWVGGPIKAIFGIDSGDKAGRAEIERIKRKLVTEGRVEFVRGKDKQRHDCTYLRVVRAPGNMSDVLS